jgi:hypothetical protein
MQEKLTVLEDNAHSMSTARLQHLHDKWDTELGQFMSHSEKLCTRFKSCSLEYSPTVGQWLKRRAVLRWMLRWHEGKVPDPRNVCRAARRANIANPLSLPKLEVQNRLQGCLEHHFELQSQAPALQKKHLQWRLSVAKDRGDDEASTEILRIVKHEARRQHQRTINRVVKDSRGRSVLSVQSQLNGAEHTFTNQKEVERVCGEQLGS